MKSKSVLAIAKAKSVLSAPEVLNNEDSEAFLLSGSALSYQLLGEHNEGLLSLSEMLRYFDYLRILTDKPFIIDGQAGFGNPLNTFYSVKAMENHGADIILINDQKHPSHSSTNKQIHETLPELAGKLKAALDSHSSKYSAIWLKLDCLAEYRTTEAKQRIQLAQALGIHDILIDQSADFPTYEGIKFHHFDYQNQSILD
ncbi:isocitrate lyase/phosphoenolpyruvate mutase family protein [Lactobacillus sp. Sy-1]|uniref:isocitrate lyase/phosphoenolpyruvate mutase family protein n=1 Tax=Lactobacillus sp. Sy-1 TaxID=2109645 RepID=UPI001C5B3B04|nr:isocitrate lyase/phosphoenolpyruvate mutase family protein [Lactobacillus sp. Sy-1]MBW1605866.1 isocitrate lyase/phosphoenolpyruvate mutase family protein [Lactobacillus sp. Sy-1]